MTKIIHANAEWCETSGSLEAEVLWKGRRKRRRRKECGEEKEEGSRGDSGIEIDRSILRDTSDGKDVCVIPWKVAWEKGGEGWRVKGEGEKELAGRPAVNQPRARLPISSLIISDNLSEGRANCGGGGCCCCWLPPTLPPSPLRASPRPPRKSS